MYEELRLRYGSIDKRVIDDVKCRVFTFLREYKVYRRDRLYG